MYEGIGVTSLAETREKRRKLGLGYSSTKQLKKFYNKKKPPLKFGAWIRVESQKL